MSVHTSSEFSFLAFCLTKAFKFEAKKKPLQKIFRQKKEKQHKPTKLLLKHSPKDENN